MTAVCTSWMLTTSAPPAETARAKLRIIISEAPADESGKESSSGDVGSSVSTNSL